MGLVMTNLEPLNYLDDLILDKQIFTLRKVGRKHMTYIELWRAWLEN